MNLRFNRRQFHKCDRKRYRESDLETDGTTRGIGPASQRLQQRQQALCLQRLGCEA